MSGYKQSQSFPGLRPQPLLRVSKSDRSRAAIVDAALEFVWSHPFRDMTVSSVTAQTGLSRSAFYQYFNDLHDLMETLLNMVEYEVFSGTDPWFTGIGDPVIFLRKSLANMVDICYRLGPILRATNDAAATDERLHKAWLQYTGRFDDAVTSRIEADQEQGLIGDLDARSVAFALNRLNLYAVIEAFGQRPRRQRAPVRDASELIWISSLYGSEWLGKTSSNLVRT